MNEMNKMNVVPVRLWIRHARLAAKVHSAERHPHRSKHHEVWTVQTLCWIRPRSAKKLRKVNPPAGDVLNVAPKAAPQRSDLWKIWQPMEEMCRKMMQKGWNGGIFESLRTTHSWRRTPMASWHIGMYLRCLPSLRKWRCILSFWRGDSQPVSQAAFKVWVCRKGAGRDSSHRALTSQCVPNSVQGCWK